MDPASPLSIFLLSRSTDASTRQGRRAESLPARAGGKKGHKAHAEELVHLLRLCTEENTKCAGPQGSGMQGAPRGCSPSGKGIQRAPGRWEK